MWRMIMSIIRAYDMHNIIYSTLLISHADYFLSIIYLIASYLCTTAQHFRQHGFYTGEIHRGTRLPHGLGKWRSPDASIYMEGEWFDGHLYMKIKPQQQEHNNDTMMGQPPERQRRRASESDLSLMDFLEPIMEHSRCSDDDDDKTIKPRKPKRRARRVTVVESSNIDRKQLSKSWTAGCNYDPPVSTKSNKRPSIVHTDPIYCVPTNDRVVKTTVQKKSRFQEIKEPEDHKPIIEEKNVRFCREIVSPFQEVKDPPADLFIPPADISFCRPCV